MEGVEGKGIRGSWITDSVMCIKLLPMHTFQQSSYGKLSGSGTETPRTPPRPCPWNPLDTPYFAPPQKKKLYLSTSATERMEIISRR